jgi:pyridinium-3,5-biscarboxylic acid mononucleotide sulfurtransferase
VADRLVVGFDLDMTLLDTRPGIKRVWDELSSATGVAFDGELAASRLGPPLSVEMGYWVAPELVDEYVQRYRALYPSYAIRAALLLPGAREALEAVRDAGGQTLVVTAKNAAHARSHLDHLDLPVELMVGDLWGAGKADALKRHSASIYVGDHVHDMTGARAARVTAVGVTTGPCTAAELRDAGADVVLADLTEFPAWLDEHLLTSRLEALDAGLRPLGSLLVAFSGGADSALLLAAAVRALGADNVAAVTAVSSSLPAAELAAARQYCADLGVRHLTASTHEMDRAGYRANAGDRCYFCKSELVEVSDRLAEEHGFAAVATGTNADDVRAGFRPGIRAAAERGALTPLLDAGLTKAQVRLASRRWGLQTWDKPAAACLSSRIAYGVQVTPAGLSRVERAEVSVRHVLTERMVDVVDLRVRDLGNDTARVELDSAALAALEADELLTEALLRQVIAAGFARATVDERGFRSGSMNELLADPATYR